MNTVFCLCYCYIGLLHRHTFICIDVLFNHIVIETQANKKELLCSGKCRLNNPTNQYMHEVKLVIYSVD